MRIHQNEGIMIYYALPPSLENDIIRFEQEFVEFRAGQLHETAFMAKRVKMGVYLERNRSTYMCRIRCSGNIITPKQRNVLPGSMTSLMLMTRLSGKIFSSW